MGLEPMTPAERNLAAEVRGVEEGHRARLMHLVDAAGRHDMVVVKSDTTPGKEFHVRAVSSPGGGVVFSCHPAGQRAADNDHGPIDRSESGIVPCKHAAVAARRLERARLIELDPITGTWLDARPTLAPTPDVFAGLNG